MVAKILYLRYITGFTWKIMKYLTNNLNLDQIKINFILRMGTLLSISSLIIIIWIVLAKIDVIAQATGQITPDGKLKTINVVKSSIVKKIYVHEGQEVKEGQLLAQLDSSEAVSQNQFDLSQQKQNQLNLLKIEAQLKGKGKIAVDDLTQYSKEEIEQANDELKTRIFNHENELAQNQAQALQNQADLNALQLQLKQLRESEKFWQQQKSSFEDLNKNGFVSDMGAQEKIREAQEKIKDVSIQESKISSLQAKSIEYEKNREKIKSSYRENLYLEKNQLMEKQFQTIDGLNKSSHEIFINQVVSPVDGIIKDVNITNANMTIGENAVMLTIVPKKDSLQAQVYLKNEDIGQLHVGQDVKVKVASYPFQKYGFVKGKVSYIEPDATALGDTKNPVSQTYGYKINIELEHDYVGAHQQQKLLPGMSVQADIVLDKRSIWDYLVSPLKTIQEEALTQQ